MTIPIKTAKPRGFAAMSPEKHREIARRGGAAVPAAKRSFSQDKALAQEAGRGMMPMAKTTHISWSDSTFNPWIGCTKVSPACDGCYAEALMDKRLHRVKWGEAPSRTSESYWREPLAWERKQAAEVKYANDNDLAAPPAHFVFCASLADVFDNAVPLEWREALFALIRATPHLTWLLLTKRPGNIERLWFKSDGSNPWPSNAAIGCTVINQEEADRDIPKLLEAAAALNPAFTFVSIEPMLGPVDLTRHLWGRATPCADCPRDADCGCGWYPRGAVPDESALDWVICGFETDQGGYMARPGRAAWVASLRDQCAAAGLPFHFKQWGEWLSMPLSYPGLGVRMDGLTGSITITLDGREYSEGQVVVWVDPDGNWSEVAVKVGKRVSGNRLEGVIYDARPEVRHAA